MKVAVLFSGGKDSCLALLEARKEGHEVLYLLNIYPENKDSWMFHKPDMRLLKKQAEMLEIPLIIQKSRGEENKELEDLEMLIKQMKGKVDGIVAGGIGSNYQGDRVGKICKRYGLELIIPLWDYTADRLWDTLLDLQFKFVITKISCEGIPKEFIGVLLNRKRFEELQKLSRRYKFRLDFEGGEAETSVLWMPGFKKEIKIEYKVESDGLYRHFLKLKKIL